MVMATAHFTLALFLGLLFFAQLLVPDEIALDVFDVLSFSGDDSGTDPGRVLLPLLYLADFNQFFRFHVRVAGALIAVGADNKDNFFPFGDPFDYGAAHTPFGIIGMRCEDNNIGLLW